MSILLSSLKYLFKISAYYVFGVPAASCAFIVAYYFLFGASVHNGEYISGMIFAVISIMSLAVCMNFYSCYGNIALSMGATRKSYFGVSQIMKVAVCLAMFVSMLLTNTVLSFFYKIDYFNNAGSMIISFGLSIILGTVGESVGIICSRWGRIGMAIYIGICVLIGGSVGVFMVLGTDLFVNIVAFVTQSQWITLGAMVLFSAAVSGINGILYKKSIVI